MSTETIRLIRDGEKEGGGTEVGEREIMYLSLHCHHQNDSRIKMGSDESHYNVLLIARDKVTRQCPQTTTLEDKAEPKLIRTEVPLFTSLTRNQSTRKNTQSKRKKKKKKKKKKNK